MYFYLFYIILTKEDIMTVCNKELTQNYIISIISHLYIRRLSHLSKFLHLHHFFSSFVTLRKNEAHFIPTFAQLLIIYLVFYCKLIEVLVEFSSLFLKILTTIFMQSTQIKGIVRF